ncbi:hypothetical protein M2S99_27530, partial [Klebsiella pneumoniae]|uniref:hypothetical protein n=1 Tax=Klebsiella pneumoniae TaxID=573 RepID=UPI002ABC5BE5|nr:hypothetical protein [Klebsiella pneumoniae]MDZ0963704.1 hypothetical protein [Klebsiella pneumoniae]
ITPSVAEQEGQQTETEATGAPQKHHYTLNQQVGSITSVDRLFFPIEGQALLIGRYSVTRLPIVTEIP